MPDVGYPLSFWIYILVGLICGFVDSSLGMGYGVSATSVLVAFGITPAIASASIHTAEGFVDTVSAISHWKLGNLEKELFWRLVIPGIFGAIVGALFLSWIPLSTSKPLISFVLLGMGIIILFRHLRKRVLIKRKISKRFVPLLGLTAAFIDVSGGGGWGPLCTPIFILGGSEPRKAIGTVEVTEPIISFTSTIVFAFTIGLESFLWSIVIPITIGGFMLTPIAAWISKKAPSRLLGILIGIWLIILNARTFILSLVGSSGIST